MKLTIRDRTRSGDFRAIIHTTTNPGFGEHVQLRYGKRVCGAIAEFVPSDKEGLYVDKFLRLFLHARSGDWVEVEKCQPKEARSIEILANSDWELDEREIADIKGVLLNKPLCNEYVFPRYYWSGTERIIQIGKTDPSGIVVCQHHTNIVIGECNALPFYCTMWEDIGGLDWDIQTKLVSLGYSVVPARGGEAPGELSVAEVEELARMEHERWMRPMIEAGWKWAAKTNKAEKLHKNLMAWGDLSHNEQDKDRELVRGIPKILARAGYTIAKRDLVLSENNSQRGVEIPELGLRQRSTEREPIPSHQVGSPQVPGGRTDRVHFMVTSPQTVQTGSSFMVAIWAHLERQREEVIKRAQWAAAEEDIRVTSQGPVEVKRGTVLSVQLDLGGLVVEPPEATIIWQGEIGNATFGVSVPEEVKRGKTLGRAKIYVNSFPIGVIYFELHIGKKSTTSGLVRAKVKRYRSAFVSYATADENDVLLCLTGLQRGQPDLDLFFAKESLRPGQNWWSELCKVIPSRDVFYLFWSENAKGSDQVEQEWRWALKKRGINFIDPFPLVDPKEVPPPDELESLHFYDRWLAFRSVREAAADN